MSKYKVTPKRRYNHFGCGFTVFEVYIEKSFLFVSWWSFLTTCRYFHEAETLLKNLRLINEPKLDKGVNDE